MPGAGQLVTCPKEEVIHFVPCNHCPKRKLSDRQRQSFATHDECKISPTTGAVIPGSLLGGWMVPSRRTARSSRNRESHGTPGSCQDRMEADIISASASSRDPPSDISASAAFSTDSRRSRHVQRPFEVSYGSGLHARNHRSGQQLQTQPCAFPKPRSSIDFGDRGGTSRCRFEHGLSVGIHKCLFDFPSPLELPILWKVLQNAFQPVVI